MKKIILVLVLVLLIGCTTTTRTSTTGAQVYEKNTLMTKKYTFIDEDSKGEIVVNKLSKKADIKIITYLPDEAENEFMLNLFCNIFGLAFQNQTAIQQMRSSGQLMAEDGNQAEADFLKDVTINLLAIFFFDKEDESRIADCIVITDGITNAQLTRYQTTTQEELQKQAGGLFNMMQQS